jgi:hypothetical protein
MKVADSDSKAEVMAAIEAHLSVDGPQNWGVVRDRYPQIPEATWWRWVRTAKAAVTNKAALEEVRQRFQEEVAATSAGERLGAIMGSLPAAPSPDYLAKNGEKGIERLNLLAVIEGLLVDANKMRAFSVKENDDIKNPIWFDRSMERREKFVNTAINAMREVWELSRIERMFDVLVEEVSQESPDTALRIMKRFQAANEEYGFTFTARPE